MVLTTRSFGLACYDDSLPYIYALLAFFEFYPAWIAVFNGVFALINNDVYFFLASNLVLTLMYFYLLAISNAAQSPRPSVYDCELCGCDLYAFPDARHVSVMSYTIVVVYGLLNSTETRRRISFFFRFSATFSVILYNIALWANGYFFLWQLLANLALSGAIGFGFVYVFWLFWYKYDLGGAGRRKIEIWLGYTDTMFARPTIAHSAH